jgi:hypothetical protein
MDTQKKLNAVSKAMYASSKPKNQQWDLDKKGAKASDEAYKKKNSGFLSDVSKKIHGWFK